MAGVVHPGDGVGLGAEVCIIAHARPGEDVPVVAVCDGVRHGVARLERPYDPSPTVVAVRHRVDEVPRHSYNLADVAIKRHHIIMGDLVPLNTIVSTKSGFPSLSKRLPGGRIKSGM